MVSTPQDDSRLASHDPYRDMESHQTRPKNIQPSASKTSLRQAETAASTKTQPTSPTATENPPFSSHIKNNVTGKRPSDPKTPPQKKKGFFKGKGPLTIILFMIFGGGALFFSGQSILGPHLSALFTEATDVQFTSYSLRNQRLFKFMMDGGDQIKLTTFSKKFTTFTPYMKSRLAKNGIEVGHLDADGRFATGDLLAGQSRVLRYNDEIISAADFQTKFSQDVNFRDAYYKAKRGRVAGFFDDASDYVYRKLGITRNIFDDFTPTGDSAADKQAFQDTLATRTTGATTDVNTVSHETDDNGTPNDPSDDQTTPVKNGDDLNTESISGDTPETKARSFANSIAGKVSSVGGPACAALRVANLVNIAGAVAYNANAINYFMGLMENVSKAQAGEGNSSAINDVLNFFTTSSTNDITYTDDSGNTKTESVTGSPLESNGARIVLGGVAPISYRSDAFSIESITKSATSTVLLSGATSVTCSGIQAASAVLSIASLGIPGGSLAKAALGMLAETIGGIAVTGIVSAVVSAIVPTVSRMLFTNIAEDVAGIPAGEIFSQGAAAANGGVAQTASAYVPGSAEATTAQAHATSNVLAQEAELGRLNANPLDASNPHTFLGTLASSLLPVFSSSSITSSVTTIGTLASKSLSAILPGASAASDQISYTTTYGNCSYLDELGVKGDIYCNAIPTTDLSTIDIAPDDSTYESVIMRNMNQDATEILDNSELAKFITFCANRESPWGVTDANILNAMQSDYGVVVNNLPFLNDVIDIVNAAEDTANQGWATGANCVNTAENSRWDNEFKYYQRFVEDSRILDQMGAYEDGSNPVLAFQEKYYAEHPLDNSTTGYLARLTGATTDDIAFILELAEYSTFLAEYNPKELSPVVAPEKTTTKLSFSASIWPEQGSAVQHIIYADTRNRSFAI